MVYEYILLFIVVLGIVATIFAFVHLDRKIDELNDTMDNYAKEQTARLSDIFSVTNRIDEVTKKYAKPTVKVVPEVNGGPAINAEPPIDFHPSAFDVSRRRFPETDNMRGLDIPPDAISGYQPVRTKRSRAKPPPRSI